VGTPLMQNFQRKEES